MPLALRKPTEAEVGIHVVEFDPAKPFAPPTEEAIEAGKTETLVFRLRPFRGADTRRISDLMVVSDRDGKQTMRAGAVSMEKVVRGVLAIEGLTDEGGKPVERMTPEVYDLLPAWICEDVLRAINRMTLELEEAEKN